MWVLPCDAQVWCCHLVARVVGAGGPWRSSPFVALLLPRAGPCRGGLPWQGSVVVWVLPCNMEAVLPPRRSGVGLMALTLLSGLPALSGPAEPSPPHPIGEL